MSRLNIILIDEFTHTPTFEPNRNFRDYTQGYPHYLRKPNPLTKDLVIAFEMDFFSILSGILHGNESPDACPLDT